MSVNIEDIKPKSFKVIIKGQEIDCKPIKLSHSIVLSQIGELFQGGGNVSREKMKSAELDLQEVVGELMPEIKDVELDVSLILEIIEQLMEHIQPADNKELAERGVKINSDPKAVRTG